MEKAKLFTNGGSQAVRLPKEYRFDAKEVFINRIGETVVLTPVKSLAAAFDEGVKMLTEDFMEERNSENPQREREEL